MRDILVLTYFSFHEPLTQSYTLPYLRRFPKSSRDHPRIYLVTLEKEEFRNVRPAAQVRNELRQEGIEWLSFDYSRFGWSAIVAWLHIVPRLAVLVFRHNIGWIHCWATPAGAVGVLVHFVTRRPLIVDSFEPHAEAMVENGTWRRNGLAFRLLFLLEKIQARRASALIGTTEGMRTYCRRTLGVSPARFLVKPACVDLEKFQLREKSLLPGLPPDLLGKDRVLVYAGKIGGIYLDRELFEFLAAAYRRWPARFHAILLTHHDLASIQKKCREAGVPSEAVSALGVSHEKVPDYLSLADFAITPVKPVPTKRYCSPIKDGEYWAMGLPVIITADISDDSEIIEKEGVGVVLRGLSQSEYESALAQLDVLLEKPRAQMQRAIRELARKYRDYSRAAEVYKQIYGTESKVA
jgi:glycosyltransferase involved in cell wall biosynthesis